MSRILESYKKIFSLVQEHTMVSTLILLLVLLTPLTGLDAVQNMGDQIFHAAVIEGYEVIDANCQLTESALTRKTGRSQELIFLEEKISDHWADDLEVTEQISFSRYAETRQYIELNTDFQHGLCGFRDGKYEIRAQQGRLLLTFVGQPFWSVTRTLVE